MVIITHYLGEYLYPDQGGILSGLALQCRLYTSPVDAFMPDYSRYPQFAHARPYIAEQRAGDVLITPPGWYVDSLHWTPFTSVDPQFLPF